ncbi:unnamed protein product [Linum trigynum]|uniref:Uncharacterized protein n=1 Tax=Linum trigynum TaxID=586398 RepID=A0AAV2FU34_9ROSI
MASPTTVRSCPLSSLLRIFYTASPDNSDIHGLLSHRRTDPPLYVPIGLPCHRLLCFCRSGWLERGYYCFLPQFPETSRKEETILN